MFSKLILMAPSLAVMGVELPVTDLMGDFKLNIEDDSISPTSLENIDIDGTGSISTEHYDPAFGTIGGKCNDLKLDQLKIDSNCQTFVNKNMCAFFEVTKDHNEVISCDLRNSCLEGDVNSHFADKTTSCLT